jgi:predicted RNase H-like nuclease (RuvC/YqgF family)
MKGETMDGNEREIIDAAHEYLRAALELPEQSPRRFDYYAQRIEEQRRADEKAQIIIGRMKKRVAKLQQQRDHFRQQCDTYRAVLNLHPSLEHRHKTWTEQKAERERVRGLEQRIKEQAALIETLAPAPTPPHTRPLMIGGCPRCGRQDCVAMSCAPRVPLTILLPTA